MPRFSDKMAQGCALKEAFHHSMAAPGRTKVGCRRNFWPDASDRLRPPALKAGRSCCATDGIPSAMPLQFAFHQRLQQHHQGAQTGFLWPPDLLPLPQENSVISLLQFDAAPNNPSVPLNGKRPEDRKKP